MVSRARILSRPVGSLTAFPVLSRGKSVFFSSHSCTYMCGMVTRAEIMHVWFMQPLVLKSTHCGLPPWAFHPMYLRCAFKTLCRMQKRTPEIEIAEFLFLRSEDFCCVLLTVQYMTVVLPYGPSVLAAVWSESICDLENHRAYCRLSRNAHPEHHILRTESNFSFLAVLEVTCPLHNQVLAPEPECTFTRMTSEHSCANSPLPPAQLHSSIENLCFSPSALPVWNLLPFWILLLIQLIGLSFWFAFWSFL